MEHLNPLSTIPSEISRDIFSRLEVRQLLIAQCVSKEWYSFIQHIKLSYTGQPRTLLLTLRPCRDGEHWEVRSISPDLRSQRLPDFTCHLSSVNHYANAYSSRVWGSCNGFVLVAYGKHILMWNPLTSWSTKVLELQSLHGYIVMGGLCYNPFTSDYKAVLLLRTAEEVHGQCVIVSSLKNKEWTEVSFPYLYMASRDSVNFNNTFHWIVRSEHGHIHDYFDDLRCCNRIVYFDPVDDTFKILPSPKPISPEEEDSVVGAGIIDGCFCMARKDSWRQVIQVSVMKEYGKAESWITYFSMSILKFAPQDAYDLRFLSQNGNKVLVTSRSFGRTYVYVVEEDKLERVGFDGDCTISACICFYIGSFDLPREVSWGYDDDEHKCSRVFL
ncbi:unnamed protein product [Cuscuta europaea]|uniref:F-box domain-containing protein n=1 Tax=Cuscuta europaea TaxID=41803 RepID=A0A9P1EJH8_CUSEU|nr:unnamed protein product [Cuscuta europaea]